MNAAQGLAGVFLVVCIVVGVVGMVALLIRDLWKGRKP